MRRVAVTEFAFSKSVRKGRYRYVHYPVGMFARFGPEWRERGFAELYDLEADPWEQDTWPCCRSTAPRWRNCAPS